MINLSLELQEVEAALKHLAKGAYEEVAPLIAKIHGQALPQASAQTPAPVETSAEPEQPA
jgi:hypothetical protein